MKKVILLVLIAFSLGILMPEAQSAPLKPANESKTIAAKKKHSPKQKKKRHHRQHSVIINSSLPHPNHN